MAMRNSAIAAVMICMLGAPMAEAAGGPPRGVYGCYDVTMIPGRPMNIMPMPFVMFGLTGDGTYSDYDGHRGHYSYDGANGVLTLTDGSREGWRYKKVDDWAFRLIDNKTGQEMYTCPLDAQKDPTGGHW